MTKRQQLSTDHRNLIAGSAVVPGLCLMSAIWPETEDVIGFGLVGIGVCGLVVVVEMAVRRELRIRRRLAEIEPLPNAKVLQPAGEHAPAGAAISGVSMTKAA